jgi:hypothetical protein
MDQTTCMMPLSPLGPTGVKLNHCSVCQANPVYSLSHSFRNNVQTLSNFESCSIANDQASQKKSLTVVDAAEKWKYRGLYWTARAAPNIFDSKQVLGYFPGCSHIAVFAADDRTPIGPVNDVKLSKKCSLFRVFKPFRPCLTLGGASSPHPDCSSAPWFESRCPFVLPFFPRSVYPGRSGRFLGVFPMSFRFARRFHYVSLRTPRRIATRVSETENAENMSRR